MSTQDLFREAGDAGDLRLDDGRAIAIANALKGVDGEILHILALGQEARLAG